MKPVVGLLISLAALQAQAVSLRCQSAKEISTEGAEAVKEIIVYRIDSTDTSVVASNLSSTMDVFPDEGTGTVGVSFSNQCDNMYGVSFETADLQRLTSGKASVLRGTVTFNWFEKKGGEESAPLLCSLITDSEAAKALGIPL